MDDLKEFYDTVVYTDGMPKYEELTEKERMGWSGTLSFQMWVAQKQLKNIKQTIIECLICKN